jgi:Holliday junction resolvasome RuvABC ATP-dependent DNA helicase subunit
MTDQTAPVWVTIAVNVNGETRTFEADANTAANPYEIAEGLLSGLRTDAGRWLTREGIEYWKANR